MSDWDAQPLPRDEQEVRQRHEENRAAWNQGAGHYRESLDEAIEFIRAGGSNLHPVERANLGDLGSWCQMAIHLQCASGKDTLSLWNEGVERVVGVDISDIHIENARRMSAALDAPAEWHRCDILDTPHELDGTADLVYTGRGALCWIQDIRAWARVVARLLRPGGIFHVLDDHPLIWLFRDNVTTLELEPHVDYLEASFWSRGWGPSYIGDLGIPVEEHARKHERAWPLSSVVNALIEAGLHIEYLGEHREPYWDVFPDIPPTELQRIPLTFSLRARLPARNAGETG